MNDAEDSNRVDSMYWSYMSPFTLHVCVYLVDLYQQHLRKFPLDKQWILFRFREACTQLHRKGTLNDNLVASLDFELDDEEKKFINLGKTSGFGKVHFI